MTKVTKTDAEWRAQLSDEAYKVTRKHGTERAHTHDDFPKAAGQFSCVGCGAPLFDQDAKFESGTGWPSFYQPVDGEMVGESGEFTGTMWAPTLKIDGFTFTGATEF